MGRRNTFSLALNSTLSHYADLPPLEISNDALHEMFGELNDERPQEVSIFLKCMQSGNVDVAEILQHREIRPDDDEGRSELF